MIPRGYIFATVSPVVFKGEAAKFSPIKNYELWDFRTIFVDGLRIPG